MGRELVVRLAANPKVRGALATLPLPKMLALSSGSEPKSIDLEAEELVGRVERVVARLQHATFTGAADKEKVVNLHKEYVARIADVLAQTLVLAGAITDDAPTLPPMPAVHAPPPEPLQLADGQLLLLLPDRDARCAGGEGSSQLGVVNGAGVSRVLAGGEVPLAIDAVAQPVLPWRRPASGWEESLMRGIELLQARVGELNAVAETASITVDEAGHAASDLGWIRSLRRISAGLYLVARHLTTEIDTAVDAVDEAAQSVMAASAAEVVTQVLEEVRDGSSRARLALEDRDAVYDDEEERVTPSQGMDVLRKSIAKLKPEALAAEAIRSSGAIGSRRYMAGQWLLVRTDGGVWCDAKVESAAPLLRLHQLRLEGSGGGSTSSTVLSLHPWNHAPRELPQAAFEALRWFHVALMRAQHSHISDALSGQRLDTLQQCVAIDVSGDNMDMASINDAKSLSVWLTTLHKERLAGSQVKRPAAALLTAGPGALFNTHHRPLAALQLRCICFCLPSHRACRRQDDATLTDHRDVARG